MSSCYSSRDFAEVAQAGVQNQALARQLHVAELRGNACVEGIEYRPARGLDNSVIRALARECPQLIGRGTTVRDKPTTSTPLPFTPLPFSRHFVLAQPV